MRASGVLMPVSSLPSRYGIGCFSKEAYEFVDCLERAGQSKWQVLPLGPTGYGDSPYQPFSTFAGNPYFIDLDMLVEEGLLFKEECEQLQWGGDPRFVDYERIYFSKNEILRKAYGRFDADDKFYAFCKKEQEWLEPYCLFRAIKDSQNGALWTTWPEELRKSDSKEVQNKKKELEKEMEYYQFLEYEFDCQWNKLKAYANKKGITIIGDLPIYVAIDSADAWANPMIRYRAHRSFSWMCRVVCESGGRRKCIGRRMEGRSWHRSVPGDGKSTGRYGCDRGRSWNFG